MSFLAFDVDKQKKMDSCKELELKSLEQTNVD